MARQMLGATMYIEDVLEKENPSEEENQKAKKYADDFRTFPVPRKSAKLNKIEEIENSAQLLIRFAGFDEIEPVALEKIKELFLFKFFTMARQMATAERRKKEGKEIPYKSALEWTLKLNGVQTALELKTWYNATYSSRFGRLKMEISGN